MTGFSIASLTLPQGTLMLELRAVNHRQLEIQFRIPDTFRPVESALRETFSEHLKRGKIDCRIEWRPNGGRFENQTPDTDALERLRTSAAIVQEVFPEARPLTVAEILQWPRVLPDSATDHCVDADQVLKLADQVVIDLQSVRSREGARLADFIRDRIESMVNTLAPLGSKIPELVRNFESRLYKRLEQARSTPDYDRLCQEVALFASRIDVEEELSRLDVHLKEVKRLLDQGGVLGKRLDFLMQELHREANTLGSKSVANELSHAALELKVMIEQMREQIQNIE